MDLVLFQQPEVLVLVEDLILDVLLIQGDGVLLQLLLVLLQLPENGWLLGVFKLVVVHHLHVIIGLKLHEDVRHGALLNQRVGQFLGTGVVVVEWCLCIHQFFLEEVQRTVGGINHLL